MRLPEPECILGYTDEQLKEILGERLPEFNKFMYGQTVAVCQGRRRNTATGEYPMDACEKAHGMITYGIDVRCFLEGRPPLD